MLYAIVAVAGLPQNNQAESLLQQYANTCCMNVVCITCKTKQTLLYAPALLKSPVPHHVACEETCLFHVDNNSFVQLTKLVVCHPLVESNVRLSRLQGPYCCTGLEDEQSAKRPAGAKPTSCA